MGSRKSKRVSSAPGCLAGICGGAPPKEREVDVILIGAGVMSATVGLMLKDGKAVGLSGLCGGVGAQLEDDDVRAPWRARRGELQRLQQRRTARRRSETAAPGTGHAGFMESSTRRTRERLDVSKSVHRGRTTPRK